MSDTRRFASGLGALTLSAALLLLVAACGPSDQPKETSATPPAATDQPAAADQPAATTGATPEPAAGEEPKTTPSSRGGRYRFETLCERGDATSMAPFFVFRP